MCAPNINHLLFADDSFNFCKVDAAISNKFLRILHEYGQVLGQGINTEKTMMVFSKNVGEQDKTNIAAMWGCKDTKQ